MRLLISIFLCTAAQATPARRFALVVGENRGDASDQPLRYAESDAARMARVLSDLGGFKREDIVELKTPSGSLLNRAFDELAARIASEAQTGRAPLLLFYYSGHADAESLHTAGARVPLERLRAFLRDSRAAVRLAVLDSCRSGALTRVKGMHTAPAIELDLANDLGTRGEALLTSSTSDELARESDALRGSFFTHHLVSGLRGAADQSHDGRVTLAEAYDYAYGKTLAQAAQHPTFKYDLAGKGDVILTSLSEAGSWLNFSADTGGLYLILGEGGQLLGDVDVGKAPLKVGVAPGRYQIRKRTTSGDLGVMVVLSLGEERWIHDSELQPLNDPWYGTDKGGEPPPVVIVPPDVIAPPVVVAPPVTIPGMIDNRLVAEANRRRERAVARTGFGLLGLGVGLLPFGIASIAVAANCPSGCNAWMPAMIGVNLLLSGSALATLGGVIGHTARRSAEADLPPGATPVQSLLADEMRRGERRRSQGWALFYGSITAATAGLALIAGAQAFSTSEWDSGYSNRVALLGLGIGAELLGAGMGAAGGALIASGRHLISEAARGRLGPEFMLDVTPTGYAGGGGLSLQGTF